MSAVLLAVLHVPIGHPADDPFQEAEYVIWGDAGQRTAPVLIHGGLDVLPARIAAAACPADRRIACVRLVDAALQAAACAMLLVLACLLGGVGTVPALLAGLPPLLLLAVVGGAHGSPVASHQGTPGVRDLAVLAALLLAFRAARRTDRGVGAAITVSALGGVAALAPLWAYNRGLALGVVTPLFLLALCALRRSLRPAVSAALGGAAALAVVVAAGGGGFMLRAVADSAYWSRNAGLWHADGSAAIIGPALALHAAAGAMGLVGIHRAWRDGRPARACFGVLLGLLAVLYLLPALDRPDAIHMRWTLWPATLLLTMGIAARARGTRHRVWATAAAAAVALTAGVSYRLADTTPGRWRLLPGLRANAGLLWAGLPDDRSLAAPDLVRVADTIRAAGGCAFAADNAALVHLLSGAPPCSRFAFGAYIAPSEQAGVIAELQAAGPATILWQHPAWWANIDNRRFQDNTPQLAAWIEAAYPIQVTIGRHILRQR